MLKLTYTETELHLERLNESLESLVSRRVLLALRVGQAIHLETNRAAFLIPTRATELPLLEATIRHERKDVIWLNGRSETRISLHPVDRDYVEVSLVGIWIAATPQANEGTFVTVLSDRLEFLLHRLWQVAQDQVSFLTG